jgi:hypothetical protein
VVVAAELRELNLQIPTAQPSTAMPTVSDIFKTGEYVKAIQIDVRESAKTMQIKASLDPK